MDEFGRCKLADFGFTKTLNQYMTLKVGNKEV